MTEPILRLTAVEAGYDGNRVLKGISLDVPRGSTVAILGPNGHGKTTLLRTISGLVRATAGQIHFDGEPIEGKRVDEIVAAGVVHIPQGDLIFPEMTVRENLLLGAYLLDAYRQRYVQLDYIYSIFPILRERTGQVASTLSGGERRMLALGRGLMSHARLLMIDEPSLGLAPLATEKIYDTIGRLKKDNYSILLVEESPERLLDTADQVHLIDHGAVVWQGSAQDLLSNDRILTTYLGV